MAPESTAGEAKRPTVHQAEPDRYGLGNENQHHEGKRDERRSLEKIPLEHYSERPSQRTEVLGSTVGQRQ